MTLRIKQGNIDNIVKTLAELTGLDLHYTKSCGNHYQLYMGPQGRLDRTIGDVKIGTSAFYESIKIAIEIQFLIREKIGVTA